MEAAVSAVGELLNTGGMRPVLAHLNARLRYRFTGVYCLDPPLLRNIAAFDRENPMLNVGGDLTDESNDPTYRAIYHSIYQPIAGEANEVTPIDGRAMSYCGVPLWDRGDRIVATLCHFDQRARLYYPEDMRVLKAVAPLIATWVSARHLPSTRLRIV